MFKIRLFLNCLILLGSFQYISASSSSSVSASSSSSVSASSTASTFTASAAAVVAPAQKKLEDLTIKMIAGVAYHDPYNQSLRNLELEQEKNLDENKIIQACERLSLPYLPDNQIGKNAEEQRIAAENLVILNKSKNCLLYYVVYQVRELASIQKIKKECEEYIRNRQARENEKIEKRRAEFQAEAMEQERREKEAAATAKTVSSSSVNLNNVTSSATAVVAIATAPFGDEDSQCLIFKKNTSCVIS